MTRFTQGQQAVTDAVDAVTASWVEAVRQFSSGPGAPGLAPFPVVPAAVVDRFFDTGVQVLEAQRALVHSTLGAFRAVTPAADRPDRARL